VVGTEVYRKMTI